MGLLDSAGVKRRIVAALAFVLDITLQVPGLEQASSALQVVIGALGGVAVAHAGQSGTLSDEKIAGAVSLIYLLIAVAHFVPALLPLVPALTKAAGVLAALHLGSKL